MSESVFFNGKSYNRYPESPRLSHQRYFNRAGGNGLLHRDVWEFYNGPIPDGYHIHHLDGDVTNNDISNLVCISAAEHFRLHQDDRRRHGNSEGNLRHLAEIREKARDWHKSEEGRKWHAEVSTPYLDLAREKLRKKRQEQQDNPVAVQCEECGVMFPSPTGRAKVCSQTCHNRRSRRRKRSRGNVVDTE